MDGFNGKIKYKLRFIGYPLLISEFAMEKWQIKIIDFSWFTLNMLIFQFATLNNQMVYHEYDYPLVIKRCNGDKKDGF